MFRDKAFNISFLISLLWHLFWISIITIITVPTGLTLADYSRISFLGPLLKKTAFEFMLEESPVRRVEALYRRPVISPYPFEVGIEVSESEYPRRKLELTKPFIFNFSLRDIIKEDKVTTPDFFREISSVISGEVGFKTPLEGRTVIFKPEEIPKVPALVTQDKKSFKVELEFTVSPEGNVAKVTPIVSSGYPQADMTAMDYLRKWRFAPLQSSEERKDQIGRIEIELKAH